LDVAFDKAALRFLNKADRILAGRITEKAESLRHCPVPADAQRVAGSTRKLFRVRIGDYRVFYEIFYELNQLRIVRIDHRSRAYDRIT
jgi:mRNA interferase RelE/StbE